MPVHFSSEEDIHMVIAPEATLDCVGQVGASCRDLRLKGVNRERSVGSGLRSNYHCWRLPSAGCQTCPVCLYGLNENKVDVFPPQTKRLSHIGLYFFLHSNFEKRELPHLIST